MKPYYKNHLVSQNNLLIQKISTDTDTQRNPLMSSFLLDNYQRKLIAIMISHITKIQQNSVKRLYHSACLLK